MRDTYLVCLAICTVDNQGYRLEHLTKIFEKLLGRLYSKNVKRK
jgi:hypothetical protein